MLNFLLFILSGVSITNIVVNASILDYPRDFISEKSFLIGKLLSCMMCSGFWVGFLISFIFEYNILISAAIISLLSYLFGIFIETFEIITAILALYLEDEGVELDENDAE